MINSNYILAAFQLLLSFLALPLYKISSASFTLRQDLQHININFHTFKSTALYLIFNHTPLIFLKRDKSFAIYQILTISIYSLGLHQTQQLIFWPLPFSLCTIIISQLIELGKQKKYFSFLKGSISILSILGLVVEAFYLTGSIYRSGEQAGISLVILYAANNLLVVPFLGIILGSIVYGCQLDIVQGYIAHQERIQKYLQEFNEIEEKGIRYEEEEGRQGKLSPIKKHNIFIADKNQSNDFMNPKSIPLDDIQEQFKIIGQSKMHSQTKHHHTDQDYSKKSSESPQLDIKKRLFNKENYDSQNRKSQGESNSGRQSLLIYKSSQKRQIEQEKLQQKSTLQLKVRPLKQANENLQTIQRQEQVNKRKGIMNSKSSGADSIQNQKKNNVLKINQQYQDDQLQELDIDKLNKKTKHNKKVRLRKNNRNLAHLLGGPSPYLENLEDLVKGQEQERKKKKTNENTTPKGDKSILPGLVSLHRHKKKIEYHILIRKKSNKEIVHYDEGQINKPKVIKYQFQDL